MPPTPTAFLRHVAAHRRRVAAIVVATALAAAFLWALAYFVACWITLLVLSAFRGVEAEMPRAFNAIFAAVALCLLIAAGIGHRLHPDRRATDNRSFWAMGLADLLLALPRLTLSIFGTISAYHAIRHRDTDAAWAVFSRIARHGKIPLSNLAAETTSPARTTRLLLGLQLLALVEIRRHDEAWIAALTGDDARRLARPHARLDR